MKTNIEQVMNRANTIYKNKIDKKYREKYPELDLNKVELMFDDDFLSIIEALIEEINK